MKKLMIYGMALTLCLAAGCKKDNNKTTTKTYLLKQQITDDTQEGIPLDTANYSYDGNNRVTTITDGSGTNEITYQVTYDSQGRVNTAKKVNSSGNLIIEYDFFYQGSNVGYAFYGPSHVADTASFVFNDKHQVAEIDTKSSGRTTFTYDSRGNVSITQYYGADNLNELVNENAYTYDTMKNPFSQVPAGNLFLEYILLVNKPSTLINNIATDDGDPYAYAYNPDGYPVNVVITLLSEKQVKVYYSYYVK